MPVDWSSVGPQVEQAVGGVVGAGARNAVAGAKSQIAAIVTTGIAIEQAKDTMQQAEYDSLKLMQQRALSGVLQTYAAIAADIAEQAAAAAWGVVSTALKSAYPALGLVL